MTGVDDDRMEGGSRNVPFTFMLPRRWGSRIEERVRLAGMDDRDEWVRYHLSRALDAPVDPVPVATSHDSFRRQAQRLTDACGELVRAAKLIENVGNGYGDVDARTHCAALGAALRQRAAELAGT